MFGFRAPRLPSISDGDSIRKHQARAGINVEPSAVILFAPSRVFSRGAH